jgi:anti-sigma B factor antagonist
MEIKISTRENKSILYLMGRFDAHEVNPVRDWIKEQVTAGHTKIFVNLTDVNFIDSSALSTLVQGLKHCREAGGDLVLCSLPQTVRVIFELTRLDKAFRIFVTEDDALKE